MQGGVVPFYGLSEALEAVEAAAKGGKPDPDKVLLPGVAEADVILSEGDAKTALAAFGVPVPRFCQAQSPKEAGRLAAGLRAPLALKGVGLAHKSEHGAVRLGLAAGDVARAAAEIGTDGFLIEEMATDGVAELLVGVTRDPAHGFVLTIGAGGVLTEILADSVSVLVPSRREVVERALTRLRCAPLLAGYRGKPGANIGAILSVVEAVQAYVVANADRVSEVEINPLICTANGAIAVDALIRKAK